MQARMNNPATILPDAMKSLFALNSAVQKGGVSPRTLELVHLRASQINGCGFCVDYGIKNAKKDGETDERLFMVSAWREARCYTDDERAALALAEAMTRLSDRADPVPDDVWNEVVRHYDAPGMAALVLWIATTNLYNRVNVAIRLPAGSSLI